MVRCNQYSVPARFIGHRLQVKLSASTVTVFERTAVVARHQRAIGQGVKVLDLTITWRSCCASPGRCPAPPRSPMPAQPGCSPRRMRRSGPRPARRSATPPALRRLVEVLLLHRHLAHADVVAGIAAALRVGSVSADVVAVEARKAAQRGVQPPPVEATARRQQVVSLPERRLAELPGDDRPLPSVDAYDDLLGKASS